MNAARLRWGACALLSLLAPLLPAAAASQGRGAEVQVRWRGKAYPESRLPEELGAAPRAAVRAWADLARSRGWRLDLEAEGRVLLVSEGRGSKAPAHLRRIEAAAAAFEGALPVPPREAAPAPGRPAPRPAPRDPDEIPEDPEEGPPEPFGGGAEAESARRTWGSAERVLDQATAVLFVLADESGVEPVLARLVELAPYLETWIPAARQLAGWCLEEPLAALCYEWPSGVQEWRVENEIVHRTAELLCLRRFGPLPAWLVQGFAWSVEMELEESIYCFPGRSGFVYATEHTSWPSDLARRFQVRLERPLEISELTRLQRNSYHPEAAPLAWGFVAYLRHGRAACLPVLAEAYRARRDRDDRIDHGDGTWSRDVAYRMPDDVQRALLLERCGDDVLAQATHHLARKP